MSLFINMELSCFVCCEKFTLFKRKKITCYYCEYISCAECVKKYILSSYNNPQCMNCFKEWSREFIEDSLSKNFILGSLKKHRENILVDREKSKILETMPFVEQKIKNMGIEKEIDDMNKKKLELIKQIGIINNEIYVKRSSMERKKSIDVNLALYQSHCPDEDCVGYLYNNKCNICHTKTCHSCDKVLLKYNKEDKTIIFEDIDHKCSEIDIENLKLLKKNTKNCPNCRAPIYRISGCRQMFCCNKNCHTCFDWQTGEIINDHNKVHNPHLYEYLRNNANANIQVIENDNCERFITSRNLITFLKSKNIKENIQSLLLDFHRSINHFVNYELTKYPVDLLNTQKVTDMRISYILKEITEENWKIELQKIEKRNEKNTIYRQIIDMYINIGKDIFNKLKINKCCDINEICTEIENLRKYFNVNIQKIHNQVHSTSKVKMLTIDFIYA